MSKSLVTENIERREILPRGPEQTMFWIMAVVALLPIAGIFFALV